MNFSSKNFLRGHIKSILDFYDLNIVDQSGGFFQNFKDDGSVFNQGQRHLVSSCRMVFIFCKAYELFNDEKYFERVLHGIKYIREKHWNEQRQGYNWTLKDGHCPDDQTNHCYGLAFVMLAYSAAHEIGVDGAKNDLESIYSLMEEKFWDPSLGLYADEASADWSVESDYLGQNSNMHCCEAMLSAYDATGEHRYLDRAYIIARTITIVLADKSNGLVWEHFTKELEIDWEFNKGDPKNLYRPWGFQSGHQTEWAKLLLTLYNHQPEDWMLQRAVDFFNRSLETCWDNDNGGILYGFSPDGYICDSDKYFWVQAESFAAAARLNKLTGNEVYRDWYNRIWDYSWTHMVDHKFGAWFRVLTEKNHKYSDEKSIAGGKCDYHTIGACYDVLRVGFTDLE